MEAGVEPAGATRAPLRPVVKIDEGRVRVHLNELVGSTVEETLNALLDLSKNQKTRSGQSEIPTCVSLGLCPGGKWPETVWALRSLDASVFDSSIVDAFR